MEVVGGVARGRRHDLRTELLHHWRNLNEGKNHLRTVTNIHRLATQLARTYRSSWRLRLATRALPLPHTMIFNDFRLWGQRQCCGGGRCDRRIERSQFLYDPHGGSLRGRGGGDDGESDGRAGRQERENCDWWTWSRKMKVYIGDAN